MVIVVAGDIRDSRIAVGDVLKWLGIGASRAQMISD
jgi:hypothetical protein